MEKDDLKEYPIGKLDQFRSKRKNLFTIVLAGLSDIEPNGIPLRICNFDLLFSLFKNSILKDLLSQEEINRNNTYHCKFWEKMDSHLEGEMKDFFRDLVLPL